jgi:hypothetical protein
MTQRRAVHAVQRRERALAQLLGGGERGFRRVSRRSRQRCLRRPARMCGRSCYDWLCYFRADPAALRSFAAFALAVRPIEPSCLSLAKDAKRPMKCCRWTWHANQGRRGLDRIATGGASRECEEARAAPDIAKLAAFGRYCGSGFGTERPRIAAQARAVDRSRASSASPHLAKDDRKPVALSAPGGPADALSPSHIILFLETMETWKPTHKFFLVSMY